MEAISDSNQTLPPNSSDETVRFTTYSAAVHKVIVMVNAGIIGLLQLINQQNSNIFNAHKTEFLCFCVFALLYVVLRVREAIDVPLRLGLVPTNRLVGHTSHLFGGLAALMLIFVVCATFAFVLLLLWLLWLSLVLYDIYNEAMIFFEANKSAAGSPV